MAGVGRETKPQKHPLVYIVFNKIQRKSTKVVYLIKKKKLIISNTLQPQL